ncbi:hypothetical protein [Thermococcus sp. 21S9]|uniref:hypothetical protein n=1 Tax=Thermococcus sp. 21S9 TaxID=1638223 RepID=UPI00143932FE|nr:hypothetical protein [Thermococcus sp. 21S9]
MAGGAKMGLLERIKQFLKTEKTEDEIRGFNEALTRRFGFTSYLYATSEGLPIMGTFEDYELLSAKIPEIVKILAELKPSDVYSIQIGDEVYTLARITSEVLMLGKGNKVLTQEEINELIQLSRSELGI